MNNKYTRACTPVTYANTVVTCGERRVAIDVLAFPRRLLRHLVRDVFRPEVLVVNVTCYVLQILHVRTASDISHQSMTLRA